MRSSGGLFEGALAAPQFTSCSIISGPVSARWNIGSKVKLARLLRASSLPRPERQFSVGRYRIDFAYPRILVGLECEGYEYHGGRLAWKRDKRRTAWLESQGWRLIFVTWDDVTTEPEQTLHCMSGALQQRICS